jgi:hypothetical protein
MCALKKIGDRNSFKYERKETDIFWSWIFLNSKIFQISTLYLDIFDFLVFLSTEIVCKKNSKISICERFGKGPNFITSYQNVLVDLVEKICQKLATLTFKNDPISIV